MLNPVSDNAPVRSRVKNSGLIAELIPTLETAEPLLLERVIRWVAWNLNPEEVYSREKLVAWAENNDFLMRLKRDNQ